MARPTPDDRGAALTEYVGILLIIAIIVAVVAATPIGDTIRDALVRAIDTVGQNSTGG